MPTSPGLSEFVAKAAIRHGAWHELGALVGETPLLTLRNTGDGLVHLKQEARSPGGSFYDRVVLAQLGATSANRLVVTGLDAFAVSAAAFAAASGRQLDVFVTPEQSRRLLLLARRLGARVRMVDDADGEVELRVREGAVLLRRTEPCAVRSAWVQLAAEVAQQAEFEPTSWVVADVGLQARELADALETAIGGAHDVVVIADDGSQPRSLPSDISARRTWLAHREGILVGPLGAEVVETAVHLAVGGGRHVVAVVPDGGNRYLGWW